MNQSIIIIIIAIYSDFNMIVINIIIIIALSTPSGDRIVIYTTNKAVLGLLTTHFDLIELNLHKFWYLTNLKSQF